MKKTALVLSIICSILYYSTGPYWWASWALHWQLLLYVISFWLAIFVAERTHWLVAVAFFWTMASGIHVFAGSGGIYMTQTLNDLIAYKHVACFASISFMSVILFLCIYREYIDTIEDAFFCLIPAGLAMTYVTWWAHGHSNGHLQMGGMFGNPSENICFLAFGAPFFINGCRRRLWIPYLVLLCLAIVISHTVTPMLILAACASAYLICRWRSWRAVLLAPIAFAAIVGGLYWKTPYEGLVGLDPGGHGRVSHWVSAFQHWREPADIYVWREISTGAISNHYGPATDPKFETYQLPLPHANVWTGTGNGTVQIFMPHLQIQDGETNDFFLWLHSDILQTIFEQGIIGGVIWLALIGFLLWRSWECPALFSTAIGIICAAAVNYPVRMAGQALFMAMISMRILLLQKRV